MKSIVTRGLIARTRSAMNTKPPLSTQTRWISSPGGYSASISRGKLADTGLDAVGGDESLHTPVNSSQG